MARLAAALGGGLFAACAHPQQIALTIDRIDGPSFIASRITGVLRAGPKPTLELAAAEVSLAGHTWRNVRLACPELKQERDQLACAEEIGRAHV